MTQLIKYSETLLENLKHSFSENTLRTYKNDLNIFYGWYGSTDNDLPIKPSIVAEFITAQGQLGKSLETLKSRIKSIAWLHRQNGYEPPPNQLVNDALRGIARIRTLNGIDNKPKPKQPITVNVLRELVSVVPDTLTGDRDKALLTLGFYSAFRRSELCSLKVENIEFRDEGIIVSLDKSKSNQLGLNEDSVSIIKNGTDICPVHHLQEWLRLSSIKSGYIFRQVYHDNIIKEKHINAPLIAKLVKKYIALTGQEPTDFAGHSLRSGFLTSAAESGYDVIQLAQHARHRSTDTTMRYIRSANKFKNNPTDGVV